ncbi:hypothetical protein [Photobacterium minamisatsumaniensis]
MDTLKKITFVAPTEEELLATNPEQLFLSDDEDELTNDVITKW